MEKETSVSLLRAMTLLQSVVLTCIDHKCFPFTKTQLSIFTALDMNGELTMKQIAGFMASSKEHATRAVAPLADAGFISRRTDDTNRTRIYVRLTDSGKELLEMNRKIIAENLKEKLNSCLNDGEKASLDSMVSELIQILGKIK